jgi:hypothetical protein
MINDPLGLDDEGPVHDTECTSMLMITVTFVPEHFHLLPGLTFGVKASILKRWKGKGEIKVNVSLQ